MDNIREKLLSVIKTTPIAYLSGRIANAEECIVSHVLKSIADHLIDNGVTVQEWIPMSEGLPEPETEVWILAKRGNCHIITNGMYEDGSKTTEDSAWWWQETDGFEYDEENDTYLIPEGWWEYKHYNGDDEYNHAIDDSVTHWMPLPTPPKGE